MDTTEIEAAFRDWWEESYKRPPNAQAVMTHVAFAAYMFRDGLLEVTMTDLPRRAGSMMLLWTFRPAFEP
jgi:hypothetical protein